MNKSAYPSCILYTTFLLSVDHLKDLQFKATGQIALTRRDLVYQVNNVNNKIKEFR